MKEICISVSPGGRMRFISNDRLNNLKEHGQARTKRASHVLPRHPTLKRLFRWLRDKYGEKGWVASFTRLWPVVWEADLSPSAGPILGPFRSRRKAIQAEVDWLHSHNFGD